MSRVLWDRAATVLVSLAFALDWLPAYVTGLPSSMVSLTRWVAVPLILLSMVIEPNAYVPVISKPEVLVLAFAAVVGLGGGVAAGNVPKSTFVSFIPSLLAVIFYGRKRDVSRLRGILVSLLVGSWILCSIVVLAGFGLLHSELAVVGQDIGGATFERTWAGVSMTLLGPWVALLLGSLGGFAFDVRDFRKTLLVPLAVSVGVLVAIVTAQRSVLVVGILSLVMGWISIATTARKQVVNSHARRQIGRNVVLILSCIVLVFAAFWPTVSGRSFTLRYRFSATTKTTELINDAFRLAFWQYFAQDLINRPQVIAPGDQGMASALGMGPHMMLGESYYYGGFLMLVAILMLMGSSVTKVFRAARQPMSNDAAIVARVVLSVLVPAVLYLMIMPGLVTRLPYVFMGLALSLPSAYASSAGQGRTGDSNTPSEQ